MSWLILRRSDEAGRLVCIGTVRMRQPLFNYAAHIGDEASLNPGVITSPRSRLSANMWREGAVLGGSPAHPPSPWLALLSRTGGEQGSAMAAHNELCFDFTMFKSSRIMKNSQ